MTQYLLTIPFRIIFANGNPKLRRACRHGHHGRSHDGSWQAADFGKRPSILKRVISIACHDSDDKWSLMLIMMYDDDADYIGSLEYHYFMIIHNMETDYDFQKLRTRSTDQSLSNIVHCHWPLSTTSRISSCFSLPPKLLPGRQAAYTNTDRGMSITPRPSIQGVVFAPTKSAPMLLQLDEASFFALSLSISSHQLPYSGHKKW